MVRNFSQARQADSKGRIVLGGEYANRTVLVERRGDELVVRLARVIPEREAWLYENPDALGAVREGLQQAKAGKFGKGPDLKAAAKLADQIPEE